MARSFIKGYCTFQKKIHHQPHSFRISDMQIFDITMKIPPGYYHLTDKSDQICVFNYTEVLQNVPSKHGKAYLVFKTAKENKFFYLFESQKENGIFICLDNKNYEIINHPFTLNYSRVYFDTNKIVFDKTREKSTLYCSDGTDFTVVDSYCVEEKYLSIVRCFLHSENHLNKTDRFIFTDEAIKQIYGYCVYRQEGETLTCFVLLSSIFNDVFLYWNVILIRDELYKTFIVAVGNKKYFNTDIISVNLNVTSKEFQVACNRELITGDENCLTVEKGSVKMIPSIYKSRFIVEVLKAMLLEKKIVVVAKERKFLMDSIMLFLEMIHPFRWSSYVYVDLPRKLYSLLESPFPFIVGIYNHTNEVKEFIRRNEIVIVDLVKKTVKNKVRDVELPFEETLTHKLKGSLYKTCREYFDVIMNNIDIAREKYIDTNINDCEAIKAVLLHPEKLLEEVKGELKPFLTLFFETKMFKEYIFTRNDPEYASVFYCNKRDTNILNINLKNKDKAVNKKQALDLWFKLLITKDQIVKYKDKNKDQNQTIKIKDQTIKIKDQTIKIKDQNKDKNKDQNQTIKIKDQNKDKNKDKIKDQNREDGSKFVLEDIEEFYDYKKIAKEDLANISEHLFMFYSQTNDFRKVQELYEYLQKMRMRFTPKLYKAITDKKDAFSFKFYEFVDLSDFKIMIEENEVFKEKRYNINIASLNDSKNELFRTSNEVLCSDNSEYKENDILEINSDKSNSDYNLDSVNGLYISGNHSCFKVTDEISAENCHRAEINEDHLIYKDKKPYLYVKEKNKTIKRYNFVSPCEIMAYLEVERDSFYTKRTLLERYPDIFWSLCLIFRFYSLPINKLNKIETDVDFIISAPDCINTRYEPEIEFIKKDYKH